MPITQRVIRLRLQKAGINAHEKQVESTTEIYNVIEEKFADLPPAQLTTVEPAFIQPTRKAP